MHDDHPCACFAAGIGRSSNARGLEIDLIIEDGLGARAVEVKSGATIAADFFSNLESLHERVRSELPHLEFERRIVYGGNRSEIRHGTEVLPWHHIQEVEW